MESEKNKSLIFNENIVNGRLILNDEEINFCNNNKKISENSIYITGCTKNCSKHLRNIYKIINEIGSLFKDFKIIFSYDESNDNTLNILNSFKKENDKVIILENKNKLSEIRTENISNARNFILEEIRNTNNSDYKYFIMMDMDEVCNKRFNINVFKKYILNSENWDALSFNRTGYYDVWALSYDPYMFSCWHYYEDHNNNRNFMKNIVRPHFEKKLNSLKNDELIDVYSAFGGFCIYKLEKFINSHYHWKTTDIMKLIPKHLVFKNIEKCDFIEPYILNNKTKKIFDCEHRYFHLFSKKNFKAKIKVSPYPVFGD